MTPTAPSSSLRLLLIPLEALVAPWTAHRPARELSARSATWIAGVSILIAAGLSTTLSTWTYLVGKRLLLATNNEMDLGQDDLPPDSMTQVVTGIAGSLATWTVLLVVALLVCVAVADWLYRSDREAFRVAIRGACTATVWFVAWAVAVLLANGIREGELFHPAAAIRAYAQLNQKGYRGSSVMAPGPPEREPLAGRGRLAPLAILFPLIWSVGLPLPRSTRRGGRGLLVCAAAGLAWLAWWAVWQILPWITIAALAG